MILSLISCFNYAAMTAVELKADVIFFEGQLSRTREAIQNLESQQERTLSLLIEHTGIIQTLELALIEKKEPALIAEQKREEALLKTMWRFFVGRTVDIDYGPTNTLANDVVSLRTYINTKLKKRLDDEQKKEEDLGKAVAELNEMIMDISRITAQKIQIIRATYDRYRETSEEERAFTDSYREGWAEIGRLTVITG